VADDIQVEDNPAEQRFDVLLDGHLAGSAHYQAEPGRMVFTHTEVDPAFEGRGLGGRLVRAALDTARERGVRVVARCPFVARFIADHPDYQDLLATRH
jgi:hypothetical protein